MAEPSSTAAAAATGVSMTPVAGATLATAGVATVMGIEYAHVVAGIAGGVVSLWFAPGLPAGRTWISIVAGTALAAFGGPVAGPALSHWAGTPPGPTANLAALLLGTFATDILAGGRGVMRALPAWLYERVTGRKLEIEREPDK